MVSVASMIFPTTCCVCGCLAQIICAACARRFEPMEWIECLGCGNKSKILTPTCHKCDNEKESIQAVVLWKYTTALARAIWNFKYNKQRQTILHLMRLAPARSIVPLLALCAWVSRPVLVPVPLHLMREKSRGFNQSLMIAQLLSEIVHIPIETGMVIRTKDTPQQARVARRNDRFRNTQDVFLAQDIANTQCNTFVLVDDVITTGSTMFDMARAIRAVYENAHIVAFCLAREQRV